MAHTQELSLFHIPASPAPPHPHPGSLESLLTLRSLQGPALPAGASLPPDSHAGVALGRRAALGSAAFRASWAGPLGALLGAPQPCAAGALRREGAAGSPPDLEGQGWLGTPSLFLRAPAPGKGHRPTAAYPAWPVHSPSHPQPCRFLREVPKSHVRACRGVAAPPATPGLPPAERHFLLSPCPAAAPAALLPRAPAPCPPGTRAPWTRDPAAEDRPPFGWTISGGGRGVDEPHTRASP